MPEPCTSCTLWYVSDMVMNVRLCLSPGALHQSECEEERLPEHTESGRPAQRVLHHLLRRKQTHTHSSTLLLLPSDGHTPCICARVNTSSFFNAHTHAHQQGRSSSCPPVNGTWETETDALMWWCLLMCVCLIIEVPAPCWFLLCSIDWTVSRCVNFWIEWSIFYSRCSSNISATDVLSSFCSLDS